MASVWPDYSFEREAIRNGFRRVAGVDEAGRGPLAGPVVAAAVILNPNDVPEGLNDSKKLSPTRRETILDAIMSRADVGVGIATVSEIDEMNILRASQLAMVRSLNALDPAADIALVDGHLLPADLAIAGRALVKGDARSLSIAAASIVAKCTRDRIMVDLAQQHPGYGWERNAAYPTKAHLEAIRDLGITPHHRRSFKPIHNILCRDKSVTP